MYETIYFVAHRKKNFSARFTEEFREMKRRSTTRWFFFFPLRAIIACKCMLELIYVVLHGPENKKKNKKRKREDCLFHSYVCIRPRRSEFFRSHRCFCSTPFALNNKLVISTVSRWVNLFNILIVTLCEKGSSPESKFLRCSWAWKPSAGGCSHKALWLINIHTEIICLKISLVFALNWSFPSFCRLDTRSFARSRSQFVLAP